MNKNLSQEIAFTDFEFTGLDPLRHEIIEIGLIVADADTLEEKTRFETKVKPTHIDTGDPVSLAIAGYKESEWCEALELKDALEKYSTLVSNSIFACWTFLDWFFLVEACKKENLPNPVGYHALDIFSIAFEKLRDKPDIEKFKLSYLSEYFGIPKEPRPHRAVNGALQAYLLYKKLREV